MESALPSTFMRARPVHGPWRSALQLISPANMTESPSSIGLVADRHCILELSPVSYNSLHIDCEDIKPLKSSTCALRYIVICQCATSVGLVFSSTNPQGGTGVYLIKRDAIIPVFLHTDVW